MINYYEIYLSDVESMIKTMYHNLVSDIECGYNPIGKCIISQQAMINDYAAARNTEKMMLEKMDTITREKWCKNYLKKHGVIE